MMSDKRQKVSEVIKQLQSYLYSTGDDYVEFAYDDLCEAEIVKIHEAYEGDNERYCEITLCPIGDSHE